MSATETTPAVPVQDVTTTPPADTLRTERGDTLLVGYLYISPSEDGPDERRCCTEAADLAAFVARFWARHEANARGPDLWLAPHLRERFIARLVATDAKGALSCAGELPPALGLAEVGFGPRGELRLVDGHAPSADERRAFDCRADGGCYFGDDLVELNVPLDGRAADLGRLVAQARAGQLLFAPRATAGGYIYVVTAHDRARRESRGEPYLSTLETGDELRPAQRLGALTAPAHAVWSYFRRYHQSRDGNLPSEAEFAAFLAKYGVTAPPPEPPPDARLAERVENFISDFYDDKVRGPTQKQIVARLGKRKETVAAALDWLVRQNRVKLGPRGPHGEHEYLPGDR
jgi:hypothetical protein